MRKLALLLVAFALVAVSFYGCDETNLTGPEAVVENPSAPTFDVANKPISKNAYVAVYGSANVPHGWRAYVTVECPNGMFPFGGYHTVKNAAGGTLPSYDGIDIINAGVAHDWRGDGSMDYAVGVEDNRAVGTPTVKLWVRAYCFDAGFLKGKQAPE